MQHARRHCQVPVGRDDIDDIRLQTHRVSNFDHLHGGVSPQQLNQHGFVRWIQVLNHHVSQATVCGDLSQELADHYQPTGRSAYADSLNRMVLSGVVTVGWGGAHGEVSQGRAWRQLCEPMARAFGELRVKMLLQAGVHSQ